MKDLENRSLEFPIMEDFLTDLKQKFRNENDKLVKIVKLKKVKQESKIIKEFIQKFRRAVRECSFEKLLDVVYIIVRFTMGLTLGLGLGTEIDSGQTQ